MIEFAVMEPCPFLIILDGIDEWLYPLNELMAIGILIKPVIKGFLPVNPVIGLQFPILIEYFGRNTS